MYKYYILQSSHKTLTDEKKISIIIWECLFLNISGI